MTDSHPEADPTFGEFVRQRRTQLGLTQEEVAEAGGPSVAWLRMVENNDHAGRPRYITLSHLDRVLKWLPGTADKLSKGAILMPEMEMEDEPPLGVLLREGRTAMGLSVRGAARAAGLSEARWRQLELGHELRNGVRLAVNPKPATVIQAADAIQVDAEKALHVAGFDGFDLEHYRTAEEEGVDEYWVKFGKRVAAMRADADISQVDLAKSLAGRGLPYHQATIYKIEAGLRRIPSSELVPLAEVLGVTVDMLLGRTGVEQVSRPATIDSLVYLVRSATVADLQRLRDVVDTALAIRTEGE